MTLSKKIKIDIVIPFYNENQNLKVLIPSLYATLNSLKKYQFRLVFIDDGSNDLSSQAVLSFKKNKKIKKKFYTVN